MEKEPMTLEKIGEKLDAMDSRFDGVDQEIRKLGVTIEEMDDKFTAISEGQDAIREVLETRVAHIEEILDIKAAV